MNKSTNSLIHNNSKDTTLDRIFKFYTERSGKIILSEKEDEIRVRWEKAFHLLVNYRSNEATVSILESTYGISKAQAYRDVRNAKQLFGDVTKSSKEADRYILNELAMKTYQLAASKKDVDGMNRSIANMIKITGVDKEDSNGIDWSKLEPNKYHLKLDEHSIMRLESILKKGAINLSDLLTDNEISQETEYTEFNEDPE